jgi:hypothetical protein
MVPARDIKCYILRGKAEQTAFVCSPSPNHLRHMMEDTQSQLYRWDQCRPPPPYEFRTMRMESIVLLP